MDRKYAAQIAELLNSRNRLTRRYDWSDILDAQADYIYHVDPGIDKVLAAMQLRVVQRYQSEVLHLSVAPSRRRQGLGTRLLEQVEQRARERRVRALQCTTREDNGSGKAIFGKMRFVQVSSFHNGVSGNNVTVWQKVLSPVVKMVILSSSTIEEAA